MALLSAPCAEAGPLFDDYLNYVRPGIGTGPGAVRAICLPGQPIGQTFTLPARAAEIYRIGIRPAYETWTGGQRVTMTLFDSPRRKIRLGQYSIDQATSHVQPVHVEKGKETDRVLYFQFRAPAIGRLTFYFEISVASDGKPVAFQAFDKDTLPLAQSFPERGPIKDLSFECDVKPVADREANLQAFFTQRLDLLHADLAGVKEAVEVHDWDKAIAEAVKHFNNRRELWSRWLDLIRNPRKEVDARLPDLLLRNMLMHEETDQPAPWRPESYWTPEYPTDRKQESKTVAPSPYTWHFERSLGRAFFDTKQEKYARKAIDLRMQFILDNPSPKVSGLPWYFELWNDRTAAGRAPGYGTWAYAYFLTYPGFSDDERLVYLSFVEDNARWDYKSTSGANWGAEAARACYEFGVLFPEWKMSREYVDWGTHRLAEIVLKDVRGDGTSTEAAIKYHAMVARRLKSMLEHHFAGRIQLEPALLEKLLKSTESMYEVMAYTLQPNDVVVMCGDSWNENYAYAGEVMREDIKDARRLALRLKDGRDPLSVWIASRLTESCRGQLDHYDGGSEPSATLMGAILGSLYRIVNPLRDPKTDARPASIYTPERFAGVSLSPLTQRLLDITPASIELEHMNRLLLSDAYADCIEPAWKSGELASAAQIAKRPDFTWVASQGRAGRPPQPVSKVFPDGGYFIMRSDFGAASTPHPAFSRETVAAAPRGRRGTPSPSGVPSTTPADPADALAASYLDSRQLFIHNGGWFGSHGHADLLSLNLYAFGRTLLVDPGQYDYKPPKGIGEYWRSSIHSMLVMDGQDTRREPGQSEWTSNNLIDYFDGQHHGYKGVTVRRRVVFIKPDYFVIDDSSAPDEATALPGKQHDWAQVWDLTDPQAKVDEATKTIQTTFSAGGNLLILSQDPAALTAETVPGNRNVAESKNHAATCIVRLHRKSGAARFTTMLLPYDGPARPDATWSVAPLDKSSGKVAQVTTARGVDWIAFGQAGQLHHATDRDNVDADCAAVFADGSYAWSDGKELTRGGKRLAWSSQRVHSLAVRKLSNLLQVEVSEPQASLALSLPEEEKQPGKTTEPSGTTVSPKIVLNGKEVNDPVIRDGIYYPFADRPETLVADDRDAFEPITKTNEWTRTADPRSWQVGYTQHETDPGRHEAGKFTLHVPLAGQYALEVFIPETSLIASDHVDYLVPVHGAVAPTALPLLGVHPIGPDLIKIINKQAFASWINLDNLVVSLNQQAATGWIKLGDFDLPAGPIVVTLINQTTTDGLYLIADAVRLVKKKS